MLLCEEEEGDDPTYINFPLTCMYQPTCMYRPNCMYRPTYIFVLPVCSLYLYV